MKLARAGLLAMLALPLLGAEGKGCAADREVPVTVVRGGAQCGGDAAGPSVRRLASAAELQAAFSTELGAAAPAADFEGAAVLLVAAGQRPTAGHAVELLSAKAPVKDGVALVQVALRGPPAGKGPILTCQKPSAAAVALARLPFMVTSMCSPGVAQPQTGSRTPRCNTA